MENASKALLIAAAVLIVVLLVAFGMRIFNQAQGAGDAGATAGTIKDGIGSATDKLQGAILGQGNAGEGENNPEVLAFNAQFSDFIGNQETAHEVLALANLIASLKDSAHPVTYSTPTGEKVGTYMPNYAGTCTVKVTEKENRIY